jgi:hypothetical protein
VIVLAEPTDLDMLRVRSEFLEMPGLCMTIVQAARLFGVREKRATDIFSALEREGFLTHDDRGVFRRAHIS